MPGFLYFKPQHMTPVSRDDVKTWGLSYAFERTPQSGVCRNNTPSGTAGSIFADPSRHADGIVKMDMAAQVWRKMPRPGQQDMDVGYFKDSPPGPEDLKRANQLSGYLWKLADGQQWLVPTVRMFDESSATLVSTLPSYIDIDDNGKPIRGQVMPLYAHLWELTAPFAEQMLSDEGGPDVSDEDITLAARSLLQVNDVVDLVEMVQLRLLSTEQNAHNIVALAVDWPTYLKWAEVSKKKTPSLVTAGA
jgi:hypothetical protein